MTKCPECKTEGAYIGLNVIECKNKSCRHWDKKDGYVPFSDKDRKIMDAWFKDLSNRFGAGGFIWPPLMP